MAGNDFLPREDTQLQLWLSNFATICEDNAATLGLSTAELTTITSGATRFDTDMKALEAAKNATKSATGEKNDSKAEISAIVRAYAKEFKANTAIPQSLINLLNITSNNPTGPVVTVTGLDVTGCDDGINQVKFDRTGNAQGTTFIIEYKVGGSAFWLFGDAITRTTWEHTGQTPGVQVWYRVTSARAGQRSVPSVAVAAYPNTESGPLSIAA